METKAPFSQFDLSKWPLVEVTLNGSPQNKQEFEEYLSCFKALYDRKQMFSLVIDSTNVGWVPMSYLCRQAAFIKEIEPFSKIYLKKTAIVITSSIAATFLKIIFSIKPPVTETKTFPNTELAKTWVMTLS